MRHQTTKKARIAPGLIPCFSDALLTQNLDDHAGFCVDQDGLADAGLLALYGEWVLDKEGSRARFSWID